MEHHPHQDSFSRVEPPNLGLRIEYEAPNLEVSKLAILEHVDDASSSLLDSIIAAHELLVHRISAFPHASSSVPSLFSFVSKRAPPKGLLAVLKASTQSFKDLALRVQWLHQAVTLSAPAELDYQLVLNHVRIIEKAIQSVLSVLRSYTQDTRSLETELLEFNRLSTAWVATTQMNMFKNKSRSLRDTESSSLQDQVKSHGKMSGLDSIRQKLKSMHFRSMNPLDAPSSEKEDAERSVCLLETLFLNHRRSVGGTSASRYDLYDFVPWAQSEFRESVVSQEIGSVQSVRLFRSRKKPLHHEFAVIAFENDGALHSWLRVERAARLKGNEKLKIQSDSFGPLFSGVTLRETVMFGSTMKDLVESDVDVLASVAVEDSSDSGMVLADLGSSLFDISQHEPVYKLFTSNCRYFARRSVLNFAQRFIDADPSKYTYAWNGESVGYKKLLAELKADPFGGPTLVGPMGTVSQAEGCIQLALDRHRDLKPEEALKQTKKGIDILESMKEDSFRRQEVLGRCWTISSQLLRDLGQLQESYEAGQKACLILSSLPALFDVEPNPHDFNRRLLAKSLGSLSTTAVGLNKAEEAISLAQQAVDLFRAALKSFASQNIESDLADALANLCQALRFAYRPEEAIGVGKEALDQIRQLYEERPDIYRDSLVQALSTYALALSEAKRPQQAWNASDELITILRQAYSGRPDKHRSNLARVLISHATNEASIQRWDESIKAMKEGAELLSFMTKHQPGRQVYDAGLLHGLSSLASQLHKVGRLEDSLEVYKSAMAAHQFSFGLDPDTYRPGLASILLDIGSVEKALEHWDQAISKATESIEHYRRLTETHPDVHSSNLIRAMASLAHHLYSSGQHGEALKAGQEAVDLARACFEQQPETYRKQLADRLYFLATYAAQLLLWDECIAADKESIQLYKHVAKTRPDVYEADVMTGQGNLAGHLSQAGRVEESVKTVLEALDQYKTVFGEASIHRDVYIKFLKVASSAMATILGENLALQFHQQGRGDEALIANESVLAGVRESLTENTDEDKWVMLTHGLADGLRDHGNYAAACKRWDDSVAADSESIELYKRLANVQPAVFNTEVLAGQRLLIVHLLQANRLEEAIMPAKEAVSRCRKLYGSPVDDDAYQWFIQVVATIMSGTLSRDYASELRREGHYLEAVVANQSLISNVRVSCAPYSDEDRPTFLTHGLAEGLRNHAVYEAACGHWDECIAADAESLRLYRQLADLNHGMYIVDVVEGVRQSAEHKSRAGLQGFAGNPSPSESKPNEIDDRATSERDVAVDDEELRKALELSLQV